MVCQAFSRQINKTQPFAAGFCPFRLELTNLWGRADRTCPALAEVALQQVEVNDGDGIVAVEVSPRVITWVSDRFTVGILQNSHVLNAYAVVIIGVAHLQQAHLLGGDSWG